MVRRSSENPDLASVLVHRQQLVTFLGKKVRASGRPELSVVAWARTTLMCRGPLLRGEGLIDCIVRSWREAADAKRPLSGPTDDCREWEHQVATFAEALLPLLNPAQAEIVRRIDLWGQLRSIAMTELKMRRGAFDVALHRARSALLEKFSTVLSDDYASRVENSSSARS